MNIKKSLIKNNKLARISLGVLSLLAFLGTVNIVHGDDNGTCTPDYSCGISTCLTKTCIDPICGQTIYGQNAEQSCIDSMPCTQTLAGEIGNCTGNPTTPSNPSPGTPTDPTSSGNSAGKASADALTKPGDLLVYMGTYGTVEGGNKYTAECQAVYAQIQADLTANASNSSWYNEYIAEIKVRNMLGLLEETVENMGDGLSGQGAIDFVNKYVNPILVSKNLSPYSSAEISAAMAVQSGTGVALNDDKDKLTASKISDMFSNTARYSGPAGDGCIEAFQPFYCANLWITGDSATYSCCKTPTPPQSGCECSGNPGDPFSAIIYCPSGQTCQNCKCVAGSTPTETTPSDTQNPTLETNPTKGAGTVPSKPMVDKPSGTSFATSPGKFRVTSNNASSIFYTIKSTTDGSTPTDPAIPVTTSADGSFIGYDGSCSGCSFTDISLTYRGGSETKYKILFKAKNSNGDSPVSDIFSYSVAGSTSPTTPICAASFSASTTSAGVNNLSLMAPATAYLDFSSTGADRMTASCTKPLEITPAVEVPSSYVNYPFPFTATQTGTETCTFVPYKNGVAGTPCSASVIVSKAATPTQPTDTCECTNGPFSGGSACTGGTCDGCHCDYSKCTPDCNCAASTPVGSTCSNGCGGTCNGTNTSGTGTIPPATNSKYKSITQFQQSYCERDTAGYCSSYTPKKTGFRNLYPPSTDPNYTSQNKQSLYMGAMGYGAAANSTQISYSESELDYFKVYFPPSSTEVDITLANGQDPHPAGSYLYAVARFGEPPTGDYSDINQLKAKAKHEAGKLSDITGQDYITTYSGGITNIFSDLFNENTGTKFQGGWVYVRVIRSDTPIHSISASSHINNLQNYTAWYNNLTTNNGWQTDGDPNDSASASPDCAQKTCLGNSCYNGTTHVAGEKTTDCATGEAKMNPTSIKSATVDNQPTVAETAFLTWNTSTNTKKLEVACAGPTIIPRMDIQLTSALWQADAAKSGLYTKPTTSTPDGYPGWFHPNTYGTEICTFYPTNTKDGLPGTPFSAFVQVNDKAVCGNNIVEGAGTEKEECDYTPSTGLTSYVPCPDGKTCQDCKCVSLTKANNYICQPDNPGCEKTTCKNVKCDDGCNEIQGLADCDGTK
jgi:hypothetical protein